MNISNIRIRLKKCSDCVDKTNLNSVVEQNQHYQDFMIWLCGYMEGIEDKNDFKSLRELVYELKDKNENIVNSK